MGSFPRAIGASRPRTGDALWRCLFCCLLLAPHKTKVPRRRWAPKGRAVEAGGGEEAGVSGRAFAAKVMRRNDSYIQYTSDAKKEGHASDPGIRVAGDLGAGRGRGRCKRPASGERQVGSATPPVVDPPVHRLDPRDAQALQEPANQLSRAALRKPRPFPPESAPSLAFSQGQTTLGADPMQLESSRNAGANSARVGRNLDNFRPNISQCRSELGRCRPVLGRFWPVQDLLPKWPDFGRRAPMLASSGPSSAQCRPISAQLGKARQSSAGSGRGVGLSSADLGKISLYTLTRALRS